MMCVVFLVWEHSKMWVNSGVGNYSCWLESSGSIFSLCLMGDAGCQLEPQQGHHQNTHTRPPYVAWASQQHGGLGGGICLLT